MSKIYDFGMSEKDHEQLIEAIQTTPGFHAISGYPSDLYDKHEWDERHEWDVHVSIGGHAYTEGNHKLHLKGKEGPRQATEILWIKDNR